MRLLESALWENTLLNYESYIMFFLDIETLSTKEHAVVLSIGLIHVDPIKENCSYEELVDSGIFVKLDAKYQIDVLKRHVEKDTVSWWGKQAPQIKSLALNPSDKDVSPEIALKIVSTWINEVRTDKGEKCWIRGFMDSGVMDDLAKQIGAPTIFPYNAYRDVRTAIDLIYPNSKNGYVDVDPNRCLGYAPDKVIKHQPVHDCAFDAAMLLYGKSQ